MLLIHVEVVYTYIIGTHTQKHKKTTCRHCQALSNNIDYIQLKKHKTYMPCELEFSISNIRTGVYTCE